MRKNLFIVSMLLLSIEACQKDSLSATDSFNNDKLSSEEVVFQYAKIGEQHPNPLEISNIISAFDQLPASTKSGYLAKL